MIIVKVTSCICLIIALFCVFGVTLFAQPAAYQFTPLADWVREAQGDTIVFAPKGEPPGSVFNTLRLTYSAASLASRRVGTDKGAYVSVPPVTAAQAGSTKAPASNSTDGVIFSPPPGWRRSTSGSTTLLVRTVDLGFGSKQVFVLQVFPTERVQGTLTQTFSSLWKRRIDSMFITSLRPLPLRARLRNGAALLYDGDSDASMRQNNAQVSAFLYVATDGVTAVPVVGIYKGWGDELKRDLDAFFGSLRIGNSGRTEPMFTLNEVVGVWQWSSSALGDFVDARGNYRGDASAASGETMTIRANGTCESHFASIGGGRGTIRQHNTGRCRVEDDVLIVPSEGGSSRYRITGVGRSADGKAGFLLLGVTRDDYPFLHSGSLQPGAGDLYVSVR